MVVIDICTHISYPSLLRCCHSVAVVVVVVSRGNVVKGELGGSGKPAPGVLAFVPRWVGAPPWFFF